MSKMEKTQALADYYSCNEIVSNWLAALDESSYSALLSLKSYNKLLSQKKITEMKALMEQSDKMQEWYDNKRKEFEALPDN